MASEVFAWVRLETYAIDATPAQHKSMAVLGLRTVRDLVERCKEYTARAGDRSDADDVADEVNLACVVLKRHLIAFLNQQCACLFLDFAELRRQGVLLEGGTAPRR